jgi:hypothetical protein
MFKLLSLFPFLLYIVLLIYHQLIIQLACLYFSPSFREYDHRQVSVHVITMLKFYVLNAEFHKYYSDIIMTQICMC